VSKRITIVPTLSFADDITSLNEIIFLRNMGGWGIPALRTLGGKIIAEGFGRDGLKGKVTA